MTDSEIIALACAIGGSKFSSTDEHCISFEVHDFLAFARELLGPPITKPDPRYDARCALRDKTDWS